MFNKESKKKCVEHTEEVEQVESLYSVTRLQQAKIECASQQVESMYAETAVMKRRNESAPRQEEDIDIAKKGVQEMSLTDTNLDILARQKIESDMETTKTLEQEEGTDITKTSVEETGLADTKLEREEIGSDMVDARMALPTASRLLANVVDIPYAINSKVCLKLNNKDQMLYRDFRMLGENMGYDKDVTRNLEQRVNPTNELLQMWGTSNRQATVGKLIELLKEDGLKRMDVVEILEDWVQKEASK